ncbi:MAG: GntR family transcriptional regulator [Planctomycetota bacterium]
MFLKLDPGSGVPIYRQIMDGVRYSVAGGTLAAGDRLPSVRELATSLGVNPTTIQKAYGELEHLGVIETRRGQGTFVADAPPVVDETERRDALEREAREWIVKGAEQGAGREALEDAFRRALEDFFGRE